MSCSVTVTGKIGAGATITSQAFTNVTLFVVDPINKIITIQQGGQNPVKTIDIATATTFTVTISGGNYTVTVS